MSTAVKVTHTTTAPGVYDIKADGVLVGTSTKGDKGKFNFTAVNGAVSKGFSDVKTMRDLKVEVTRSLNKAYVDKNRPVKAEKEAKAPSAGESDEAEAAASAGEEPADTGEDITLD